MRELLPQKFSARIREQLGEEAEAFFASLEDESQAGIRVNTGKIAPETLAGSLFVRPERIPWTENGFYAPRRERKKSALRTPGSGAADREREEPFCLIADAERGEPSRPVSDAEGGAPFHPVSDAEGELSKHPYYYAGLYYIQEPSAMLPASRLPIAPGDCVLDLCAAPGGKATELAAKLQGTGLLVANDVSASRARALLKNLTLWGAPNICVTAETPERLLSAFGCFFDKILVDAPCSGEGMFRRDHRLISAWEDRGPEQYAPLQKEILACAVRMLKPGGMLLYSTCTFSREEDEEVIADALSRFPELTLVQPEMSEGFSPGIAPDTPETFSSGTESDTPETFSSGTESDTPETFSPGIAPDIPETFSPEIVPDTPETFSPGTESDTPIVISSELVPYEKCVRIYPHRVRGEGHFLALMRKGSGGMTKASARERNGFVRETKAPVQGSEMAEPAGNCLFTGGFRKEKETLGQKLPPAVYAFLTLCRGAGDSTGWRYKQMDDQCFLLPPCQLPSGIRYLRTGLLLGTLRKDRFEPSQAFAMCLDAESYAASFSFLCQDERVLRYLKGETIALAGKERERLEALLLRARQRMEESLIFSETGEDRRNSGESGKNIRQAVGKRKLYEGKRKGTETGRASKNSAGIPGILPAGWVLVCVDGHALGWAKYVDGTLRNKYNPGWRMQ